MSLMPAVIHEMSQGDYSFRFILSARRAIDRTLRGMDTLSVACAEDTPFTKRITIRSIDGWNVYEVIARAFTEGL
jgi:hypothetical protein